VTSSATAIAISVLVAVTPARAQSAGSKADELYNEGRALVAANKLVEACTAFEQSQKLEPAITTLIALATCRERLDQLATAWGLFLDAERRTRSVSNDKTSQLHQIALDRAAQLEPRVSKLTISIPAESRIDGLQILRDQELIPAEKWNRALPIDGGTYKITARAPGVSDWSMPLTLANASDSRTIVIPNLRSIRQTLAEPSRELNPPDPSQELERRSVLLPIAVGAAGVALLSGALGLSRWGDATYNDAKGEMTDQARRDALHESANRKRYAAEGLAVAGAGCAGAAVWLYLRQRGTRAETASTRAGHLMLTPTVAVIGVLGRF